MDAAQPPIGQPRIHRRHTSFPKADRAGHSSSVPIISIRAGSSSQAVPYHCELTGDAVESPNHHACLPIALSG